MSLPSVACSADGEYPAHRAHAALHIRKERRRAPACQAIEMEPLRREIPTAAGLSASASSPRRPHSLRGSGRPQCPPHVEEPATAAHAASEIRPVAYQPIHGYLSAAGPTIQGGIGRKTQPPKAHQKTKKRRG